MFFPKLHQFKECFFKKIQNLGETLYLIKDSTTKTADLMAGSVCPIFYNSTIYDKR